ncbi:hypothetical protein FRX31_028379, partial [Thalictrum thalictroides]
RVAAGIGCSHGKEVVTDLNYKKATAGSSSKEPSSNVENSDEYIAAGGDFVRALISQLVYEQPCLLSDHVLSQDQVNLNALLKLPSSFLWSNTPPKSSVSFSTYRTSLVKYLGASVDYQSP